MQFGYFVIQNQSSIVKDRRSKLDLDAVLLPNHFGFAICNLTAVYAQDSALYITTFGTHVAVGYVYEITIDDRRNIHGTFTENVAKNFFACCYFERVQASITAAADHQSLPANFSHHGS